MKFIKYNSHQLSDENAIEYFSLVQLFLLMDCFNSRSILFIKHAVGDDVSTTGFISLLFMLPVC